MAPQEQPGSKQASPPKAGGAPAKARPPRKLLLRQPIMFRVVYALLPLLAAAIYFFGWRALAVVALVYVVGFATEHLMERRQGKPVSSACFVTCMLYGLSLPPTVPLWIAGVGIVVAILFGKEVFGGFGRNFANPAIVGRAFVYVCFPVPLTAQFVPVFRGFPGGLAHWSMESFLRAAGRLPDYLQGAGTRVADAVTQASPMWVNKAFGESATYQGFSIWNLLLGNISGTFEAGGSTRVLAAGSMGEGCALLIAAAAVYLLVTKTANWRLMLSAVLGLAAATVLFRHVLGYGDLAAGGEWRYVVPPFHYTLLAGTTAYGVVFMVTDPVSAPNRNGAKWAYGFLIGFLVVFLRWRGVFVAAASFAILLGNIVGPLLDVWADWWRGRRKANSAAAMPQAARPEAAEREPA